jgi:hypothetical protein
MTLGVGGAAGALRQSRRCEGEIAKEMRRCSQREGGVAGKKLGGSPSLEVMAMVLGVAG